MYLLCKGEDWTTSTDFQITPCAPLILIIKTCDQDFIIFCNRGFYQIINIQNYQYFVVKTLCCKCIITVSGELPRGKFSSSNSLAENSPKVNYPEENSPEENYPMENSSVFFSQIIFVEKMFLLLKI